MEVEARDTHKGMEVEVVLRAIQAEAEVEMQVIHKEVEVHITHSGVEGRGLNG